MTAVGCDWGGGQVRESGVGRWVRVGFVAGFSTGLVGAVYNCSGVRLVIGITGQRHQYMTGRGNGFENESVGGKCVCLQMCVRGVRVAENQQGEASGDNRTRNGNSRNEEEGRSADGGVCGGRVSSDTDSGVQREVKDTTTRK